MSESASQSTDASALEVLGAADTLVIDLGAYSIKSGFGVDDEPVFHRSVVGQPRRRYVDLYHEGQTFVGEEVIAHGGHLSVTQPLLRYEGTAGHAFEELLNFVMMNAQRRSTGLPVSSEQDFWRDKKAVITVPPEADVRYLTSIGEIIFTTLGLESCLFATGGLMSLFGGGNTTGIGVEIGHSMTQIVPAIEGFTLKHAMSRLDLGGVDVTQVLQHLLCDQGFNLTTRVDVDIVRDIKEQYGCVATQISDKEALGADTESIGDPFSNLEDVTECYKLPDGYTLRSGHSSIDLNGKILSRCGEIFFDPGLLHRPENESLTATIWKTVKQSPLHYRKDLLSSIFLSGGCAQLRDLDSRLAHELMISAPPAARGYVNLETRPNAEITSWIGGRIFSDPSWRDAQIERWVLRDEFESMGNRIHEKVL